MRLTGPLNGRLAAGPRRFRRLPRSASASASPGRPTRRNPGRRAAAATAAFTPVSVVNDGATAGARSLFRPLAVAGNRVERQSGGTNALDADAADAGHEFLTIRRMRLYPVLGLTTNALIHTFVQEGNRETTERPSVPRVNSFK